jgi:hypothetical protein
LGCPSGALGLSIHCSWLFNPSLLALQSIALGYSIRRAWLFNLSLLAIQSFALGSSIHCSWFFKLFVISPIPYWALQLTTDISPHGNQLIQPDN